VSGAQQTAAATPPIEVVANDFCSANDDAAVRNHVRVTSVEDA